MCSSCPDNRCKAVALKTVAYTAVASITVVQAVAFITAFFGSDFSRPQGDQAGRFSAGVSIERAISASSPNAMDEGPSDYPSVSEEGSGKNSGTGIVRLSSRRWTGRYGMVCHVMSWCGIL